MFLGECKLSWMEGGRDKAARLSDVVMDLGLVQRDLTEYSGTDICDTF